VARVKKIIHADDDIGPCSNNAAFAITVATEMFLQHLVEQSYNIVKSERKPRRNIQYRDVGQYPHPSNPLHHADTNNYTANAVARVENLEFLGDVVPKQITYREYKKRMAENVSRADDERREREAQAREKGQGTLDSHLDGGDNGAEDEQATNGASHDVMDVDDEAQQEDDEATEDNEESS
jgi:hypothetical protein